MTEKDEIYPEELRVAEEAELRRKPRVGLALSGGGIRSATFSLGFLQALAKADLLRRIDILSTVSGGGFIGSFLGALYARPTLREDGSVDPKETPDERVTEVQRQLTRPRSFPLRWLRESGNYMSPNGAGDAATAVAAFVRNWLTVQLIVGICSFGLLSLAILADVGISNVGFEPFQELRPGKTWSPLFAVPAALLALWAFPAAAAYWHTWRVAVTLATALAGSLYGAYQLRETPLGLLLAGAAAACVFALGAGLYFRRQYPDVRARRRNLTTGLKLALLSTAVLALIACIDGLGLRLYEFVRRGSLGWEAFLTVTGLATPFALAQKLAGRLVRDRSPIVRLPHEVLALVVALLAATTALVVFSALAYALAFLGEFPGNAQPWQSLPVTPIVWGLGVAVVASLLLGHNRAFLNLSSHHTLYAARLTRAYLGASNPKRWRQPKALSDPIPDDDISWGDYKPHARGGPLHIINVTLNETIHGETQVDQRTRKGDNMAIGPCGVSVSARHHALWTEPEKQAGHAAPGSTALPPASEPSSWRRRLGFGPKVAPRDPGDVAGAVDLLRGIRHPEPTFEVFDQGKPERPIEVEPLTLGEWVAVSGAAFTTGLGTRTSLGLSLLLGIFNIRLGYWWASGLDPALRSRATEITDEQRVGRGLGRLFPVQSYLLDEFLGRFHGTGRKDWYLSDGGHFDNTAAYELIRRRIPFIMLCDNGCDPEYAWSDLGDLVRRVRTDFGAEVEFLDEEKLNDAVPPGPRALFAPWREFRRFEKESVSGRAYAALARIRYCDTPDESTLLVVKPNLSGAEPSDLLTYWAQNKSFPQQTTLDQYFDEAQWESYRCLGECIGSSLFTPVASASASKWSAFALAKLPEAAVEKVESDTPARAATEPVEGALVGA